MRPLLSVIIIALGASAAWSADGAQAEGYSCTIESRHNTSINEPLPVTNGRIFISPEELAQDGPLLTKRETLHDGANEADTTHRIDGATGEYRATTLLTDHKFGEQYIIEEAGTCTRSTPE